MAHPGDRDGGGARGNGGEMLAPTTRNDSPFTDPARPVLGRVIGGNFRVVQLIGAGAMGHVYQAEQLSLGKMVALKLLRDELMGDEKLIKRFELEARSASQLDHPNSIQIIDFGRDGDLLYIAMELLPGVDLGQLILREGPLPPARIGRIMDQVLAALDEAHAHGIVHRDLKPGNIMLVSRRGDPDHVKVCDFGIAKAQTATEAAGLTLKGLVCGTPEYMSPEQARGEEVDGRSDLYAVGVILYQLVTGELPFTASSPVGILSKHLAEDPVRPTLRQPGLAVSPAFEDVIMRALEKEPMDRPATAQELRRLLRAALADVTDWSSDVMQAAGPTRRLPSQPTTPLTVGQLARLPGQHNARGEWRAGAPPASTVMAPATASTRWPRRSLLAIVAVLVATAGAGWLWLERTDRLAADGFGPGHRRAVSEAASTGTAPAVERGPASAAAVPAPSPAAPVPDPEPAAPLGPAMPAASPDEDPVAEPVRLRRVARKVHVRPAPDRRAPVEAPAAPSAEAARAASEAAPSAGLSRAGAVDPPPPGATPATADPMRDPMKEAERLLAQGEVAAACKKVEEQKVMTPRLPAVYKLLGKCYMRSGQPERARANYRQYLELSPNAADAAFIKSMVK
jgi:eukaryotic-like serine/threonine-protein kinase